MQNLHSLTLALSLVAASSANAQNDPVPNPPVPVAVQDVFVPVGFDDNDEVEVVLDGYLPDTCYKLAFTKVTFNEGTQTYAVRQYARKLPGVCFETPVPFTTEAAVGLVKAGSYLVRSRGAEEQALTVGLAATESPDEYMYAPVDAVRVERVPGTRDWQAVIEGRFTSTCMRIAELRLVDSGRTLQLLPIMRMLDQDDCRTSVRPFVEKVRLPRGMTAGRHLLHVRSLNGKARNAVFTVD